MGLVVSGQVVGESFYNLVVTMLFSIVVTCLAIGDELQCASEGQS